MRCRTPTRGIALRDGIRMLLAVMVGLLAGCSSVRPQARFTVGLYAVPDVADFDRLRSIGFNLVVGDASERYLDAAERAGIQVLAQPGTSVDFRAFDCRRATEVVRRFDRHPALWGWYLSDEPDLHRVPPVEVARARDCVRRAGGGKPTVAALSNAREADLYGSRVDRVLLDRYPVPWLPLADFPKQLRLARFAAGPDRPVYAVVQAFDWAHFRHLLPVADELRPPSHAEMRAMTFLALLEGVQGILFYSFKERRWSIEEHPETWEALQKVVREIREWEPLFLAGLQWRDFDVGSGDPRASRNEALDPAIQAARVRVGRGSPAVPRGDYVIAVNTLGRPVAWRFGWPGGPDGEVSVLGGEPPRPMLGGWITEDFEPYGVRIFGPLGSGLRRR